MEKMRTINGMPIKEVFNMLKGEIPNVIRYTSDNEGNPYLESNALRRFFDSIIPLQNYEFSVTEPQIMTVGESVCFTLVGTITVFDDDGNKVVSKSYVGSENCIIIKDTGKPKNVSLDIKNAAVSARKECMRLFGCGESQLEKAKAEKAAQKSGQRSGSYRGNKGYGGNNGASKQDAKASVQPSAPAEQPRAATHNPMPVSAPVSQNGNEKSTAPGKQTRVPPIGKSNFRLVRDKGRDINENSKMILVPVLCREYNNYRTVLLIWKNSKTNPQRQSIMNRIETEIEFDCLGKFEAYMDQYRIVYEKMEV